LAQSLPVPKSAIIHQLKQPVAPQVEAMGDLNTAEKFALSRRLHLEIVLVDKRKIYWMQQTLNLWNLYFIEP